MSKLRVLDLFSGIGGFSLGLERTGGFETAAFCEIDPFCQGVLAAHWPEVPIHDDVATIEHIGPVDVVTGGFPCQDVSVAGDVWGLGAGISGERTGLFWHILRTIRLVGRPYVLLENVAALLDRGMGSVLGDLAAIGYDAEWHCIPASAVGARHRRDRIWIVANPGGEQHEGHSAPLSGSLAAQLPGVYSDPESERRFEAGKFRHEQPSERSPGLCEEMADAHCTGFPVAWHTGGEGEETSGVEARGAINGASRRAVEPDLGRMADGFSAKLDKNGEIDEQEFYQEASSGGSSRDAELHRLRGNGRDPATASSGLFEADRSSDPLYPLPCEGRRERRVSTGKGEKELQGMRGSIHTLAQQEEFDVRTGMPFDTWPHERDEKMGIWDAEPDVPRVATGVKERVDRLAELGNAVVPQIPEIIGRSILAARAAA